MRLGQQHLMPFVIQVFDGRSGVPIVALRVWTVKFGPARTHIDQVAGDDRGRSRSSRLAMHVHGFVGVVEAE